MNEAALVRYITETFDGVQVLDSEGTYYFFYDPTQTHPFITLVTNNKHDQASDLDRPSVFRLNIGVGSNTYRSMFGSQPAFSRDGGVVDTGHDFAALDQVMPHPIYAAMSWVCVLNPSAETFESVKLLLAEAYNQDVQKHSKH